MRQEHRNQDVPEGAFERLRAALPDGDLSRVVRSATRLRAALGDDADLAGCTVMVAYGGGKDSSYAVAFVRAMQLVLDRIYGSTFRVRVVTSRHAGMPRSVMENIDRVYRALELRDDPRCELLVIDGDEVSAFDVDLPLPQAVVERGRADILMSGHRSAGDGRPTFCNACNLNMVHAFAIGASHDGGVDVIVTGDSPDEQYSYYAWVTRLAHSLKVLPKSSTQRRFGRFLEMFDGISGAYFADVHGEGSPLAAPRAAGGRVREGLRFFSIYEETNYESGAHWEFLTQHMGFVFDDIAFSFSESDCGNPGLMAHLRGLKGEYRYGTSYAEALGEYVEFAVGIMKKKDFPEQLVEAMRRRYAGQEGVRRMRAAMDAYALAAHRLTGEQLVCMIFSPFVDRGANLSGYLSAVEPGLAVKVPVIHALLAGTELDDGDDSLRQSLERLSGLTLEQLRQLYGASAMNSAGDSSLLSTILAGDPHKKVIKTRRQSDGALVEELISGR
ncbi:PqqD family protein [Streptomyces tendae]|uniref:PqqD family protein n=1 Tax=Streptomyces tendae TaxID=1932 RepID=UPI002492BAFA|nr:PqqD family protein [Streptomyces tendae]